MSAAPSRLHPRDLSFANCFICKREACGRGYQVTDYAKPRWYCRACGPDLARKAAHMSSKDLNDVEKSALSTAGQAGGRYLDSIEKTDLAVLTPDQWERFLEIVLRTYEVEIRDRLKDIAPPQLPAF